MKVDESTRKTLQRYSASHYSIIDRRAALDLGVSSTEFARYVNSQGRRPIYRGVWIASDAPVMTETMLMAALLACGQGACLTHRSAGWIWGLLDKPPTIADVTVPRDRQVLNKNIHVVRRDDLGRSVVAALRGLTVTSVPRTLIDLAEVVPAGELATAVDRARARRLVTVEGMWNEIDKLCRRGRRGVAELRAVLNERGLVEAPAPSVLESYTMRLLRSWGIEPISVEYVVYRDGHRYRLDFMLLVDLALEVDGFAYHSSPEAKAKDARRRGEIRLGGIDVIEADWVTVMRHPEELKRTVFAWLRRRQAAAQPQSR